MSTSDDFLGRMQSNWRRRASERTTFADEFRVVPVWLVTLVIFLYGIALLITGFVVFRDPQVLPEPLVDQARIIQLLAMAGIVTAIAIPVAAFIFLFGYIGGDAQRRGMNPALWVLLSIFIPYLIGVIIYFLVREPLPRACPNCGRVANARFNFCPNCRFNLRPNCPQCRREIQAGDHFCLHCGSALGPTPPSAVPGAP